MLQALPIIVIGMPRTASTKSRNRPTIPDEQPAGYTPGLPKCVNLDEVLSSAVKLACDILKSDNASIALADEKGVLTLRTQLGLSEQFVNRWQMKSSEGLAGIVFRTGEPYACRDLQEDKNYSGVALKMEGLRALLVTPLKSGCEVIGCLYVSHRTPHDFAPAEVRVANLLADHVSMSIESATLLRQEQQQRRRSEALLDVVSAPSLSLNLKQVLVKLCQSVLKLTIAERCSMFMFNEDTHTLEPVMSLGVEDPKLWERFRCSAGLKIPEIRGIGEAIKAQEPVIEEHVPGSRVLPSFWIKTFGTKSLAIYPLVHREKTIGVLEVDSFSKFVRFPAEEIETLAAIARQAAVIIENARLYEKEQGQRQRAEALVEVLTATASTLSQKKVLIKLCEAVIDISVGERCSIFLLDSECGRLEPVMSLGARDEKLWQKFRRPPARVRREPGEQRFLQAATTWDKPIVVEDAENSPILPRWWVNTFSLKSLVQYPLRVKDRTIGAMTVHTSRDRVHFPQEEIETLAAVAKQAAVIIENARLHEQLQEQAITDPVTNLYNHRHIHQRLDEEIARASRTGKPFAVMMIDLDRFKLFNDTHGHPRGDEALRFVASQLRAALRTSDTIGRYGGDEFLAVLPDTTREDAQDTGKRIISMLADRPFVADNPERSVALAISIGIAYHPDDGTTKDELVALADAALYEAKRLGGNRAVPASAAPSKRASPLKKISA
jgi:diguanylate cyclase (GGDEF)-like protein